MTKHEGSSFVSVLAMNDTGPAPEAAIVRDLVKRGLWVAPALVGIGALVWGSDGACQRPMAWLWCLEISYWLRCW